MEFSFWKSRWETGQIGFHEGKANALLAAHAGRLDGARRVLVPLAGKAHDMLFLRALGHEVVGVELVEQACREFFEDNHLAVHTSEHPPFRVFRDVRGGLELLCGDVFDVTTARVGTFDAIYDRAALIALDPMTRGRYVDTLHALLAPGGRVLLVTFVYDQTKLPGPPWSVDDATVEALFSSRFRIEKLEERPAVAGPRFQEAGVTELREAVFLLTARSASIG